MAAGQVTGLPVFLGSYPITPASDILHELSKHKAFGVTTFQAEDEIAGVGAALGAAFGGALGVTTTSGPGISLKSETIGLAVALELPLLVIDVQRGGPSTGLPTKTEQADLLQAMFGRNGEAPLPILAPRSPGDCFGVALEAARIAVTYRTPVIAAVGRLGGQRLRAVAGPGRRRRCPAPTRVRHRPELPGRHRVLALPARRRHARPAVGRARHAGAGAPDRRPGEGRRPRVDLLRPGNHDRMVRLRAAKIAGIPVPDVEVDDPTGDADLLVLGWGSTYGPIGAGARRVRKLGHSIATAHLRHLSPLPANLGEVLRRYRRVLVPEMNLGQLALLLRGEYLVDVLSYTKVAGAAVRRGGAAERLPGPPGSTNRTGVDA